MEIIYIFLKFVLIIFGGFIVYTKVYDFLKPVVALFTVFFSVAIFIELYFSILVALNIQYI